VLCAVVHSLQNEPSYGRRVYDLRYVRGEKRLDLDEHDYFFSHTLKHALGNQSLRPEQVIYKSFDEVAPLVDEMLPAASMEEGKSKSSFLYWPLRQEYVRLMVFIPRCGRR
jgi:hypothetical protein